MTSVRCRAAQLDAGAVADAVLRLLQDSSSLLDRLAGDLGRLQERPALVGDAVDAAVGRGRGWVAEVVLHVADDRVLPVEEVDGAVRPDLDVRRAEVRVGRGEDRLDLGAGEAGAVVLDLVLQDALEADHVGDEQVALVLLGEVPAGEDLDAGAGPGPLLVDLRRPAVLAAGSRGGRRTASRGTDWRRCRRRRCPGPSGRRRGRAGWRSRR